jgi:hypothetical protein
VLLAVALSAQLTGGAMFGPPGRKNRFIEPEAAAAVAQPAALIALVALVVLAVVPIPAKAARQGAELLAALVGGLLLLLLVYRLWTGTTDGRGFDAAELVSGLPLLWAGIVPALDLIIRLELSRRTRQG